MEGNKGSNEKLKREKRYYTRQMVKEIIVYSGISGAFIGAGLAVFVLIFYPEQVVSIGIALVLILLGLVFYGISIRK